MATSMYQDLGIRDDPGLGTTMPIDPKKYAGSKYQIGVDGAGNPIYGTIEDTMEYFPTITDDLSGMPAYFQQNPDVAAEYSKNTYGLTPEQFAAKHYELYGAKEGRTAPPASPIDSSTKTIDPSQSTVSPNFEEFINNMLTRGSLAAMQPYQEYTGERFAGPSALQTQAFQGLASLQAPEQYSKASNVLEEAAKAAKERTYDPTKFESVYKPPEAYKGTEFANQFARTGEFTPSKFDSTFTAPEAYKGTDFVSTYTAPEAYKAADISAGYTAPEIGEATKFTSTFTAPEAYTPTSLTGGLEGTKYSPTAISSDFKYDPTAITTGLGPVGTVESYMSPYQQSVIDIEAREAARRSAMEGEKEQAQFAQAGAYGGARQAIVEAERARNLAQLQSDIQSKGLQGAYDRALSQRMSEAGLGVTAQTASEQARQFKAKTAADLALEAQKASEASRQFAAAQEAQGLQRILEARKAEEAGRQFGAQQKMTGEQLSAQLGLDAQKASELARQFNTGQQMTAAQLQAQFGLDAQKAEELSRQFGAGQAARSAEFGSAQALEAQKAGEQAGQFGAAQGMTAADLSARYGLDAQKAEELSKQFAAGQQLTADELSARYGLSALQAQEASKQFGYGQQAQQAGLGAQYGLAAQQAAEQSKQFGATQAAQATGQQIAAGQGLASLGAQQQAGALSGLQATLGAGATQQALTQQPLDFGYQQFQESLKYPYQQATYMSSLLQGMPVTARPYDAGQSGLGSAIQGGVAGLGMYNLLNQPTTPAPAAPKP